ncbi:glycosyltransferase [Ruegeria pomeroyi]|uniref:glycosyltransferase n=1 Tax=Ruegeria pomeroyi TaxID=89184 RepID=UPI001F434DEA|nr:glycosyltransferase [Ruegeria pomeroyi]MCE8510808.1 glycosyltransferase [Ruegeria pomeroyi]
MTVLFWTCLGLILFSLVGYGLLWIGLARLVRDRPAHPPVTQSATVLIAARNEARDIGAKIRSLRAQRRDGHRVRVLVVSDGSEDATLAEAEAAAEGDADIQVIGLSQHGGKAAALNHGLAMIPEGEIVIFSDANSLLDPDALIRLLAPFADPGVGGSIGQLGIKGRDGLMAGAERLYWRYDNALKGAEDRIAGTVSAQGTLYAVRRRLVGVVPADMADDLAISLGVVARGYRLAYAPGAVAREAVTSNLRGEFGRRVRSTERGWRGLMHYAGLMNPGRTGLYAVQLFCHKVLRRLVAVLLPLLLLANVALLDQGAFYVAMFGAQVALCAVALAAVTTRWGRRLPGASVAVLFVMGHAAIFWALLRYAMGVRSTKWAPVRG